MTFYHDNTLPRLTDNKTVKLFIALCSVDTLPSEPEQFQQFPSGLWTEHKTNEEVLQMVDAEREMMDTLRSRQKRWLGHILRHDSLLRTTLEGRIQGKQRLWKTKNNVLGLVVEDGGRQYQL